ncbi:hypothetical protein [uncultured Thiodictyon sp.]|uniref:hypothetical protein n=1 Tax=uncultured Thiodictyon sp. TaxID=1846217 RepID=UPI0025CF08DE|nr:hypothetical protein [uncultured Thiodictyon sp.]
MEHNFLPGRTFADWPDLNAQARAWCETVANQKVKRSLGTAPRAAFEEERPALRPLPVQYVQALVAHAPGRGAARLKRLLQFQRTYPSDPFLSAVAQALTYGLYDLTRLESLILKQVRGDFFQLPEAD